MPIHSSQARENWWGGQSEERGLFVIMRAGCPVCDVYTPRLKSLIKQGLEVKVVALDNLPLSSWPSSLPDDGQAKALGVIGVPTTFLFENGKLINLGAGLIPKTTLLRHLKKQSHNRTGKRGEKRYD